MGMKTTCSGDLKAQIYADTNLLNTHEMLLPLRGLRQVRKARKLVIVILYIIMLTGSTFAYPAEKPTSRIRPKLDKVIVETSGCRPLTTEQLKEQMGSAYDPNKMSFDGDDAADKRSSGLSDSLSRVKDTNDEEDNIDEEFEDEDTDVGDKSEQTVDLSSMKFMRRKRNTDSSSAVDININSNGFLYHSMLYETISKRKSRRKRGAKKRFHPAWECKMKTRWKTMKNGYFPTKILDGYCQTDKCFFGMYDCIPVKYSIKVLKRDPNDVCKPVPLIGQNTTYRESWLFKRIHVTVACECGQSWKRRKVYKKKLSES